MLNFQLGFVVFLKHDTRDKAMAKRDVHTYPYKAVTSFVPAGWHDALHEKATARGIAIRDIYSALVAWGLSNDHFDAEVLPRARAIRDEAVDDPEGLIARHAPLADVARTAAPQPAPPAQNHQEHA